MPHFLHGGYVDDKPSQVNIESVNDSTAYCISKSQIRRLCLHTIEMANFGRKIFEREIFVSGRFDTGLWTPPTAKRALSDINGRESKLLYRWKYLASYLYITPQSLSRIRAGLREKEDVSK